MSSTTELYFIKNLLNPDGVDLEVELKYPGNKSLIQGDVTEEVPEDVTEPQPSEVTEVDEEKVYTRNEEEGEKPVVDAGAKESEDVHGGDEMTNSVENSPNPGGSGSNEKKEADQEYEPTPEDRARFNLEAERRRKQEEKQRYALLCYIYEYSEMYFEMEYSDLPSTGQLPRTVVEGFRNMVNKIAERLQQEIPGGDELSMEELAVRRYSGKSVDDCYYTLEPRKLLVALDTSGSMEKTLGSLKPIAKMLEKCNSNVEVIEAPNGLMSWEDKEYETAFRADVILFIGDFDGADLPMFFAERGKKIYWMSTECDRYDFIDDHSWVRYSKEQFRELTKDRLVYFNAVEGFMYVSNFGGETEMRINLPAWQNCFKFFEMKADEL